MAIQRINKESLVTLPLVPCAPVTLCLDTSWAARTVSGLSTIRATIANTYRILGGGRAARKVGFSARGEGVIQYALDVDDSQFLTDGATGLPFVLTCAGISEINPYDCTVQVLESEVLWSENMIAFPDDYDDAYWIKLNSTVVPDAAVGLDGATVDFLKEDATAAAQHGLNPGPVVNAPVISQYRLSLLVKPNGRTNIQVGLYPAGFTTYPSATYVLAGAGSSVTGAPADGSSITQLTDGWYLIRLYATPTAIAVNNASIPINLMDSSPNITYNGDGVSGVYLGDISLQYKL